jgi:hypothetical protein
MRVRQPCRAFWRGSFLFTTNVRRRRRTTIEPGRAFSLRSEFLTFMISPLRFLSAHVTTSLARSFPRQCASRDTGCLVVKAQVSESLIQTAHSTACSILVPPTRFERAHTAPQCIARFAFDLQR